MCAARPHIWAWQALERLQAAATADALPLDYLQVHCAYRSVEYQTTIWNYRINERRCDRARAGLPPLTDAALARLQQKWTAKPGRSAHHTGFALDLTLYALGKRGKRSPTYTWLAHNAARFGFYPYLPEPWHWEYNPPGLVARVVELRRQIGVGQWDGLDVVLLS